MTQGLYKLSVLEFFSIVLFVAFLALSQAWGFSILEIKPNLVLAVLIVVSFFTGDFWESLLLVFLASFILKFDPNFEKELLLFTVLLAILIIIKEYLPWYSLLSTLVLVTLGTTTFYLALAKDLLFSLVFVKELILNLIAGGIFFAFFHTLWQNKET